MAAASLFGLLLLNTLVQDTLPGKTDLDGQFPLELTDEVAEDADGSALMEALDWLRLHPYDLNSVTMEELLSVPGVTLSGAGAVLAFRRDGGRFHSADQLAAIAGGGAGLYRALSPYVSCGGGSPGGHAGHRVSLRARAVEGTPDDPSTPGSPLGISTRLTLESYRGLEAGALFAKGNGVRGEDSFLSGYALVRGLGCVSDILAGDYELESGQGLVLWRGPTAVRSMWSLRPGGGLAVVPHRSPDETRFLRGLAIAVTATENWRGVLFYSDRLYAANLDSGGEATGFFRGEYSTLTNAAKKDVLRERLAGARAEYNAGGAFTAGCTAYRAFFDRRFVPADRMRLSGDRVDAAGADFSGRYGIVSASGEWGVMKGGAHASVWSLTLSPGGSQVLAVRGRDYQPGYDNPHASGEGDNGETRNERGITASLRLLPAPGSRLECHVDMFDHPWPDSRIPIPRRGAELIVTGESRLPSGGTLSVRCSRKRSYEESTSTDDWGRDIRIAGTTEEDHFRCEVSCDAPGGAVLSSMLEIAGVTESGGETLGGVLLGGDVSLTPFSSVSLDTRISLFRTDGYAVRLYQFESSLPGLVSLPALYGHGLRWYARIRCSPAEWAEITIRYASTVKDASVSGTGPFYETTEAGSAQVSLQADIRLP